MKRIWGILFILGLGLNIAYAQTTAVTATVTDSSSQAWNNGSWKLEFIPSPNNPNINVYNINGTPLDPTVLNQKGLMNSSAALSFSAYQNGVVSPGGSTWRISVCPNATAPCGVYNFSTGTLSTLNLSSALIPIIPVPKFPASAGSYGYSDSEATTALVPGGTYWNVTSMCQRYYDGSAWACYNGVPSGATIQVNGVDLHTPSPANFQDANSASWTNPSAGNINVSVSGGIVPPNPPNVNYFVLTDSRGLSSTTSGITIPPATAANCDGTVCIITALNNFKVGNWVGFCCSGFDPSALVGNPYYAQVLSTGLSSTQFEIASTVTGTGTGGALINATYNWPLIMANKPYFSGHGTVSAFNTTSGETISDLTTFYNATIHPLSTVITGNPGYLFLLAGYDDLVINGGCALSALPSLEVGYQKLWALTHADGMQAAMLTNPANSHASDGGACNDNSFYQAFQQLNLWTKAQGKGGYVEATTGTASSGSNSLVVADGTSSALYQEVIGAGIPSNTYITACSPSCANSGSTTLTLSVNTTSALSSVAVYFRNQYWDYLVDAASQINSLNQMTQPANPPHFSDQGNQVIAQDANATLLNYLQLKTQCGHGDGCPNLQQTNWYSAPNDANGAPQMIQFQHAADYAWWGVDNLTDGTCAAFGYRLDFSGSTWYPAIYYDHSGDPCTGGDAYPYLIFGEPGPGIDMPQNIGLGWNSSFGQGTADTSLTRDSTAVLDVNGGTSGDKQGAMQMKWIAINTTHTSGNSFDCAGTNCPSTAPILTSSGSGFYQTTSATLSGGSSITIYDEDFETGALNDNVPTTVTIPHSVSTFLGMTCTADSTNDVTGNPRTIAALFVSGSTVSVTANGSGSTANCHLRGYN
jgi:hypothetical protein